MASGRITVLGSGTCVPSLIRSSCALLLEGGSEKVLLDVGPGTMHRLLARDIRIDDIDAIFLSHFHPDHAGELPSFLFSTKYPAPMKRSKKLSLAGGTGLKGFYEGLNETYDYALSLPEEYFCMKELDENGEGVRVGEGESLLRDFGLAWTRVAHRPESRAYRFTAKNGFSVVYSGDTDYSETLVDLAGGADLLISESAFPDGERVKGHLTPSLAGEIASRAQVGHLVLTHFYPVCELYDIEAQCRKSYKGRLTMATDLLQLELE
ncbi:MAG: MBL fold metallo-hydrolase [Spirochaetaceae bacterium]